MKLKKYMSMTNVQIEFFYDFMRVNARTRNLRCCIWRLNALAIKRVHIKHIDPCVFSEGKIILRSLWVSRFFFHFKWFMNVRIENECSIVIHSYTFIILFYFAPSSFSSPFEWILMYVLWMCSRERAYIGRASSHNLNWRCLKPIITWFGLPFTTRFSTTISVEFFFRWL